MPDEPDLASMFGGGDTSIKDLATFWGDRPDTRRTMGNPARSRMLAVFDAVARDCDLPELRQAGKDHIHLWAGEEGWETEMLVRAVSAAKAQMTLPPLEKKKVL